MLKAHLKSGRFYQGGTIPKLLAILAICFVGMMSYANSLHGSFQFDDYPYIVHNASIHRLDSMGNWQQWLKYRFIAQLSFALNYHFHQQDVFGYHVVNLIIHLVSSILVWSLLQLIFSTPRLQEAPICRHKNTVSLFSALLFVAHPIQTEAVTYIAQRFASLATLFYTASVCLYLQGRLAERNYPRRFFLGASAITAVLGLLTKEIVVTLPLALLLVETSFFPKKDGLSTRGKKFWIYIVLTFICLLIVAAFHPTDFEHPFSQRPSRSHEGDWITPANYLLTQPRVILTYIRLLLFPWGQNFDYDFAVSKSLWEWPTFLSFLVLFFIFMTALNIRTKQRLIAFGIFWFFLTLSIESSIIPLDHVIAEYRVYLPSVGFFIALCSTLELWVKNQRMLASLMILLTATFSFLTVQRNKIWQYEITLWQDAIKKSPQKSRPYDNLAAVYIRQGDDEKALEMLQKARALNPDNFETYNNLGLIDLHRGLLAQALEHFDTALRLLPAAPRKNKNEKYALIHNNRGLVFQRMNSPARALDEFQRALAYLPSSLEARLNLAKLYRAQGETQKAMASYELIQENHPHDLPGRFALTELYLQGGQQTKATAIGKVLLNELKEANWLIDFGSLFAQQGFTNMAFAFYTRALELDPESAEGYLQLGKIYGNSEQFNRAIALWQEGLRRNPQDERFKELIVKAQKLRTEKGARGPDAP